jgi:integrase
LPGEEELLLQVFGQSESGAPDAGAIPTNPWVRPILIFALETAMRRGEILGLKWESIDLERRVAYLTMTKNGSSRSVPLSPRAVATLEHLPHAIDGRVFPVTASALKLAFKRGLKRARAGYETRTGGADPRVFVDLRFHDLRHEATSRLADIFEAHELAKITGHKDLKTLLRYYHPRPEELARKLR